MGIHLHEHNKTAYDAALFLMERTGKAAVIRLTGTGKSYIGFRPAEKTGAAVFWLSPSEYIIKSR